MGTSSLSSPDPIILPSSPPSAHALRRTNGTSISPAKSIIIDRPTPRGRINSTAEAQPGARQRSPRAKRQLARQRRRQLAGLDAATGRPIEAESPRKRRRVHPSDRDLFRGSNTNDESRESLIPLSGLSAAHYQSLEFDQDIDPRLLVPEAESRPQSPNRPISLSDDASDGSAGYDGPEDIGIMGAPGALPPEVPGETTMANEEFTLIAGQSLASIKANNSLLATANDIEHSHLRVEAANITRSPALQSLYPDVTRLTPRALEASKEVRNSIAVRGHIDPKNYDMMSWRPTGRAQHVAYSAQLQLAAASSPSKLRSPDQQRRVQAFQNDPKLQTEPRSRHESQPRSSAGRTQAQSRPPRESARPLPQQSLAQDLGFDDIWAEEASRELQYDAQQSHEKAHNDDFVPPIFSDEPQPPRRSKIPSTWRKTSGVNLSYADSPQSMRNRTNDSRIPLINANDQQTRAMTPPSTDEEDVNHEDDIEAEPDEQHDDQDEIEAEPDEQYDQQDEIEAEPDEQNDHQSVFQENSELTNPDAAATQLQGVRRTRDHAQNVASSHTHRNDIMSSDHDQSGVLWQRNHPGLLSRPPKRPIRPRSEVRVNISEILRTDAPGTITAPGDAPTASRSKGSNVRTRDLADSRGGKLQLQRLSQGQAGRERSSSAVTNNISSPLARSLFRTSNLGNNPTIQQSYNRRGLSQHTSSSRNAMRTENEAQQAKDHEDAASRSASEASVAEDRSIEERGVSEDDDEPTQSYQEYLNRHSPAKLPIDFNDSSFNKSGVDLFNYRRKIRPLLDRDPDAMPRDTSQPALQARNSTAEQPQVQTRNARQLESEREVKSEGPGLLSRLATTFWSAVIRPSGPIYVDSKVEDTTQLSFLDDEDPVFPTRLRAQLRSRYGVLSDRHPWTMTHMRTLHRMLNSLIEARPDSIVPTALPLPPYLSKLVGKLQLSATGAEFVFKFQHACAINAFTQVLVPVSLVRAMERGEVEWLGDGIAESYRGYFDDRNGSELCFRTIRTPEGLISRMWLVECIGSVVIGKLDLLDQQLAADERRG